MSLKNYKVDDTNPKFGFIKYYIEIYPNAGIISLLLYSVNVIEITNFSNTLIQLDSGR